MKMCRCGAIVDGTCPTCSSGQTSHQSFYSSHKWRKLSERKRAVDPLCERCLQNGISTAAEEVHHIVSVQCAYALRFEWSNLMSVCKACHEAIEGRNHV